MLTTSIADPDNAGFFLVRVRSTDHMGRGTFAKNNMPAGTRLHSERPLITVAGHPMQGTLAQNINAFCAQAALYLMPYPWTALETLQRDENIEYDPRTIEIIQNWVKHNRPEGSDQSTWVPKLSTFFSIYNRFAVRLPHRNVSGVFYFSSSINHSCSPNAHAFYDHTEGLQHIHLTRDVEAGEQIFVSYNRIQARSRARRHEDLRQQGHKFVCDCALCTSQEAEAIMKRVHFSYQSLFNFQVKTGMVAGQIKTSIKTPSDDKEALAIAEELVGLFQHRLINLEGPDLKITLRVCSLISRRLGNIRAAAMYAREELALQVRLWGFASKRFLQENDAEPWLHEVEKDLSRMEAGEL